MAGALTGELNGLIDFFNIAGLFEKRTRESLTGLWTHYSWRELFVRGGIIVTTAAFGMLAASTCKNEECSSFTRGTSGALFGFFVSHSLALIPTINRRNKIRTSSKDLFVQINKTLDNISQELNQIMEYEAISKIDKLRQLSKDILNVNFPHTKRGDAIRNLVARKNLLKEVDAKVNELYISLKENNPREFLISLEDIDSFLKPELNTAQQELRAG